jgi:hypothetical protein
MVKILGFGIMKLIMFFYDIQKYVSNGQAYDKLMGNKEW